jgi:hypothetical protein
MGRPPMLPDARSPLAPHVDDLTSLGMRRAIRIEAWSHVEPTQRPPSFKRHRAEGGVRWTPNDEPVTGVGHVVVA